MVRLGNENDIFNAASVPNWANNSAVFGGNGDDAINTMDFRLGLSRNVFVDGGNGDDTLTSIGGLGNTLIGGNGDDTLISVGGGSGMGPSNTLTGGLGDDTFVLLNTGNLVVTNDAGNDGVVSNGDVFVGPMDVITDYTQGEHIGFRQFDLDTNGPAAADTPVTQVDSIALAPDPLPHTGDSFRPVVGGAQFAVFHGTFAGVNSFTVNSDGPDLFVVYETRTERFEPVGKGSLVLLGVSDEQALADAFTLASAPGGDVHAYSQAGAPSAASAILAGTSHASAMDLIAPA